MKKLVLIIFSAIKILRVEKAVCLL